METINVTKQTKNEFDRELINCRVKDGRNIFSDEFIQILLEHWRKNG